MHDPSPSLSGLAGQVDSLLREYGGLEYIRDRVREAAQEYLDARKSVEERETARRAELIRQGTWVATKRLPEQPDGDVFYYREILRGVTYLQIPERPGPNASAEAWKKWTRDTIPYFNELQRTGFPSNPGGEEDEEWQEYKFPVEAWGPANLAHAEDPPTDGPLPVPKRKISLNFKYAGLAAVYDSNWGGEELVAPWGFKVRHGEERPIPWLPDDRDSAFAAFWYWHQIMTAKDIDTKDTAKVASWLKDVEADLAEAFPRRVARADTVPSDDYRSVRWGTELFVFTPTQAGCVKPLYENWRRGAPVLGEATVLELADSDAERLRDVFDKGQHPAWGSMIIPGPRRGLFQITAPKNS